MLFVRTRETLLSVLLSFLAVFFFGDGSIFSMLSLKLSNKAACATLFHQNIVLSN